MANKLGFSQKHPFLFGFFLLFTAVVLLIGAMAVFIFWRPDVKDLLNIGAPKFGVVHVSGLISDSKDVNDWIEKLRRDEEIRGVILRINSPGGVVGPSQEIYRAVKRLAKSKPVVASMASVAASGGYYISLSADKILANPGTLTGSIGVKAKLTDMHKLLQKLGIEDDTVVSGKYKDAGSPFKPLTKEEKQYFQNLIQDMHSQFVEDVAQSRNMTRANVEKVADGRAFTGRQALKYGLVDQLGGRHEAINLLKQMSKTKGLVKLVEGPPPDKSLLTWLLGFSKQEIEDKLSAPKWELRYQ